MIKVNCFSLGKTLAAFAGGLLLLASCAEGYDSPNGFDVGVNNQTLVTPDSLTFKVSTDGKTATVSWPLVLGAEAYEVTMLDVTNPDSAIVVDDYLEKAVDGCSMTATVSEDSKYTFAFKVIGDAKRGNKDGLQKDTVFSTLVPSILTIPDGSDIYQVWDSLKTQLTADSTASEVAIDLEPGGHYELSGPVDFSFLDMTFRGNKKNPAFIHMTDSGAFYTYTGLKMKYLRIDMSDCNALGIVRMSEKNLPAYILSDNLGFIRNGSVLKNVYHILKPIYFQDVWAKNMPNGLVNTNWSLSNQNALWNLTITNCIFQMNNAGTKGFICLEDKGKIIKNLIIKNSTIYNIVDNSKAYFWRYWNSSESNPQKVYGNTNSDLNSTTVSFSHVTLSKAFTGQKWCNNVNHTNMTLSYDHCIFYDLYQVFRRTLGENGTPSSSMKFNFWCNPDDDTDTDYQRTDSSGAPSATKIDPEFAGDILQPLDLEKPNGGVDFTPTNAVVHDNFGGDARWLDNYNPED